MRPSMERRTRLVPCRVLECRVDGVHPDGPPRARHRRESTPSLLHHTGYLGANVCAQNDDRDGSNRCKKILEAANDLEVSRVLLDKALKALGDNPSADQIRAALGMENMAVSSRPAPWWDSRHDLCLLKGVLEHGPLASEKVREAILEDEALDWPSDMPQAPPKPPAWLAQQAEAPAPAPAPNGDGKKKPAAKKPEKKLPHLPVCCGVRTFYPPASFPPSRPSLRPLRQYAIAAPRRHRFILNTGPDKIACAAPSLSAGRDGRFC